MDGGIRGAGQGGIPPTFRGFAYYRQAFARERREAAERRKVAREARETAKQEKAKAEGVRYFSPSERQTLTNDRYKRDVRYWAAAHGLDPKHDYKRVQQDPEFKFWFEVARTNEKRAQRGLPVDRRPTGQFAQALVELGYRRADNPYGVGSTPKVRGRP